MGLCLANPTDKFVDRDALALVPTPNPTQTWRPVPHIDVVDAVENADAVGDVDHIVAHGQVGQRADLFAFALFGLAGGEIIAG